MGRTGTGGGGALLAGILLLSGAAALLHETAWFRLLAPVAGVGAVPAAVVAAGALLGIAAGSFLGGRRADAEARPSRVLAAAEGLAALAGLLVPPALGALEGAGPAAALAGATALLAIAAVPWGVSVPAALRAAGASGPGAGDAFRRLYAWNTAGALLGIAAGAAFLLEALGNRATVATASALQAAAALLALALPSLASTPAPAPAPAPAAPEDSEPAPRALLFAAALVGAAAVAAQVAWMRRLTPVLCATFPVFTAVLAVQIGGIALGAALLGPRLGARPARASIRLAIAAAAATAGTPWLLGAIVEAVRPHWWNSWGEPLPMLLARVGVTAALALPGVLAGSAILPWLVRARAPGADASGRGSGGLLAANAAGAAAGGLAAALLLVPAVGTAGALAACGAAYLLAGACVASGGARKGLAVGAVALALLSPALRARDSAASDFVGALYSVPAWAPGDVTTLLTADGRNAQVIVRDREGSLEFWIEGSLEASTWPSDRLHLGLLGHLPLVLFEARADRKPHVAIVGLGAGFSARAAERHAPASLTIYELEPEVARAAERFRPVGGGVPASARLVYGDGRRAVLGDDGPLDLLSADPVHPAQAGSAFLYSAEYFRGAMRRLSEDGLLVQWLPLYALHEDDLRLALRTFAASVPFPYVFLAGRDALLVGCRTPLRIPRDRLARALAAEAAAPLRADGLGTPGALLALLALDPEGCRAVAGEGDINEDDRLLLELRGGWREKGDETAAQTLLNSERADPRTLLEGDPGPGFEAELRSGRRLRAALAAWVSGWHVRAAGRFADAAADDPANELARILRDESELERAWQLLDRGDRDGAAGLARAVAARTGVAPIRRMDAAEILSRAGARDEARAIARPYAESHGWPRARRLAE